MNSSIDQQTRRAGTAILLVLVAVAATGLTGTLLGFSGLAATPDLLRFWQAAAASATPSL